ncbi:hypothetical protein MAR_010773 [Mya arenaria]|uniref:Uncharacterized protein n=1 Tax=Mya arenaria TaxID=6604 RepID=A0ABY7FW01_MYAAR|nr:hypothetical protein MAR_010773 [Mya arenaria]
MVFVRQTDRRKDRQTDGRTGDPLPGPADYLPRIDLTKKGTPHYSIGRKITLKGRGKCYFDAEADKSISILGKYKLEHRATGKEGPRFRMGGRPPSNVYTGPANSLVQPVDTKGFNTPGPNYRPNSSYWGRGPKMSFGHRNTDADHSGPAVNKFSPAANTYDIGTTIGKAPAISIAGRPDRPKKVRQAPCPSSYNPQVRNDADRYRGTTLAYKWFEPDGKTKVYVVSMGSSKLSGFQEFAMKESPRRFHARSEYSLPTYRSPISDAGSVSLPSIRSTTRQSMRSYRSNMGSRMLLPSDFDTPGPDAYNIKSTIGQSPGALFKGDRSRSFEQAKSSNAVFLLPRLANATPAPGAYNIESGIGKGLKSTFGTARRDARFAGDRNNNAVFLISRYDDPSPPSTRYNLKSSIGSHSSFLNRDNTLAPGSSFSRAKRDARFAGDRNARFLLPRIVPKNPPPDMYKTEDVSSFGKRVRGGVTFGRERRNARFPGDTKAKFLLMERTDKFRRPHSYTGANL